MFPINTKNSCPQIADLGSSDAPKGGVVWEKASIEMNSSTSITSDVGHANAPFAPRSPGISGTSTPSVATTYRRIEQQARVTRWVELVALTLMVVAVLLCVYSVVGT